MERHLVRTHSIVAKNVFWKAQGCQENGHLQNKTRPVKLVGNARPKRHYVVMELVEELVGGPGKLPGI